jgi:excinuclease ABC subunit C
VVKGLFNSEAFAGFGLSRLSLSAQPPSLSVIHGTRPGRLKAQLRGEGPRCPGVYGMVNEKGELIYVGKAKNLRVRLLSYFRPKSRDPKAGWIVEQTRAVAWEPGTSEFAALLRELELIRRWRPRCNVQGQPHNRRRVYICVGRQPAPYVFLSSRPPCTAAALFGPIPGGSKPRDAVRRVNDWYRLRDCPQAQKMIFAEQKELFPVIHAAGCMRHELGACLGPCAAACTRQEYKSNVRAVLDFLRGVDRQPLEMIQREMEEAAAAMAFERAGALRDKLEQLRWLEEHLDRLRKAARHSFVYPVRGHNGSEAWYLIQGGRVRGALARPHDEPSRQRAKQLLEQVYRSGEVHRGQPLTLEEIDGVLLVMAWFRRHPAEQQRVLTPAAAVALCGERNVS